MRLDSNTAAGMTTVVRDPKPVGQKDASPAMLELLDRVRAGAVLVTARNRPHKLQPELDGEPVHSAAVSGLIRRGMVRPKSHTSGTTTWEAND